MYDNRSKRVLFHFHFILQDTPSDVYFDKTDKAFKDICVNKIPRDRLYISQLKDVETIPFSVAADKNEGKKDGWKGWFQKPCFGTILRKTLW